MRLSDLKAAGGPIDDTASASLWDAGDGVVLLEVHTRLNQLDMTVIELIERTLARAPLALVIGNEDERAFSAGVGLAAFEPILEHRRWDDLDHLLAHGQEVLLAMRYAPFPVVAAIHGLTWGGGCELMLHTDAVVAHAGLRVGLPERWSGLIPGWSGGTQLLRRWQARGADAQSATENVFHLIAPVVISDSAETARRTGFLAVDDPIVEDRAALLAAAKAHALALAQDYAAPPPAEIAVAGAAFAATFEPWIEARVASGAYSDFDAVTCQGLARALCDGDAPSGARLREQQMGRIEHEVFAEVAKRPGVLERMRHMRDTGRPLNR